MPASVSDGAHYPPAHPRGHKAPPLAGAAMAALGLACLPWLRRDGRVRTTAAASRGSVFRTMV